MTSKKAPATAQAPKPAPVFATDIPPDLKRLHELCKLHAIADRELDKENAALKQEVTALVSRHADYMIEMSEAKKRTLAGIEELIRQNPVWLGDKRSLKTPHGVVSLREATSLVIADEDRTLALVLLRGSRIESFDAGHYYKDRPTLDKESLEKLDDRTLKRLGVVRLVEDKFSFKLTSTFLEQALSAAIPTETVEPVAA